MNRARLIALVALAVAVVMMLSLRLYLDAQPRPRRVVTAPERPAWPPRLADDCEWHDATFTMATCRNPDGLTRDTWKP